MKVVLLAAAGVVAAGVSSAHAQSPPSKTLERAIKLYDAKDNFSASIELYKVVNRETKDDAANRARAEFFLAKTFYQMKLPTAALAFFQRIADAGDSHRYFGPTLKWYVALARMLPLNLVASGLSRLEKAKDEPINEDVRDEVLYLLVRIHHRARNTTARDKALDAIPAGSLHKARAHLAIAIAENRQGNSDNAASAARAALEGELPDEERAAAQFVLGRAADDDASLDAALAADPSYAELVSVDRLFRGTALDAHSTDLAPVLYPVVCKGESDSIVATATATLEKIRSFEDNAERYEALRRLIDTPAGRIVANTMVEELASVDVLDEQLLILEKADRAWQTTQIAAEVLQELTLQKALAEADAGKLAGIRVEELLPALAAVTADKDALAGADTTKCAAGAAAVDNPSPGPEPTPAPQPKPKTGCAGCSAGGAPSPGLVLLALLAGCLASRRRRSCRAASRRGQRRTRATSRGTRPAS